jgi:signal transduction histidine kinase
MDLDIPNVVAATIHLKEKDGNYTMWDLTALDFTEGKFHQPMVVHYRLEEVNPNLFIKRMWENTDPYFVVVQDEEDFKRTIQFLRDHGRIKEADESEDFLKTAQIKNGYHPTIPLNNGRMCIDLLEPPSDEIEQILTKMGAAFDLAYKRFEDLKNSEAQLREAQIEAALERVRSRSMAMHKSDELLEASEILFVEMQKLGVESLTAGYVLMDKEEKNGLNYTPDPLTKKILPLPVIIPHNETVHMQRVVENWKKGNPFFIVEMNEEETINHQTFIAERSINFSLNAAQLIAISPAKLFLHNFYFKEGYVLIVGGTKLSAEQTDIMLRFAKVFQQTYTRFLDLQKAEFQTRQAKIETALEKVRARALAMQQPEELTEVAQVMRHEMGLLGVEELETSSIYIHDDASGNAECWYAIKDSKIPEKKLVSDHFKLNLQNTWVSRQMYAFYHSKEKQISIPMQGANRKEWINYCSKQSKLLDGFYGEVIPDRTYHLYKFSNGTIGAATPGNISSESWDLLQRAASVFSLAYSRFKDLTQARIDLQKLKEEKQRAEDALTELQVTQKQLIQSEKMASLGELTAGIAHEIQNPLNFVNNFSEVSSELVDEMNEEIAKGNIEDAKQIAEDLKQNLEKINHHGKRAGDIVKGMLQHSRSSTATKEPTDINKLADEYLRLAYYGLRAKDKSFNATMKTDFDASIGNINIIPQDIGRVILNLITNAFYVVNERLRQAQPDIHYEPTVSVITKKEGDKVLISVKDNGNGIPQKILDKIFQPFFTTKPTGQGTGLGLSLSYDIVKAHGGELKVATKEGEGSEFVIMLPV